MIYFYFFFFSSRRRHTRFKCDWSSDVCSSDLYTRWNLLVRSQRRRQLQARPEIRRSYRKCCVEHRRLFSTWSLPPGESAVTAGTQPWVRTITRKVAMATVETGVRASVGFASKTGPRKGNEDFAGALSGPELPEPRQEVIAAIADGIGGAKGGRIAAETAVRGFLDGFCDLPETMEVQRAGSKIISALNGWINTMARQDPKLTGMGCTLTALVLRGRVAHLLHIGDTRAYRLSGDRMACLTTDHVRQDVTGRSQLLNRALGGEAEVRLDYATQPVAF